MIICSYMTFTLNVYTFESTITIMLVVSMLYHGYYMVIEVATVLYRYYCKHYIYSIQQ